MIAGGLAVGQQIEDGGSCLENAKLRCDAIQRQRLGFGLCAPDRTVSPLTTSVFFIACWRGQPLL
jgi:hypothetical protein